jgi:hypothetical protein
MAMNAALALLFGILLVLAPQRGSAPPRPNAFASLVERLSERPGYFDTDNLISNERSYLHVAPELRALAGRGRGVYLGVGPDQNFSYIAHVRPSLAVLIDIRRDNLLLHLLFKALFAEARTRAAYLAMLTGRAPPPEAVVRSGSLDAVVNYIDRAAGDGHQVVRRTSERGRPCNHRSIPPAVRGRRTAAAVQQLRPSTAVRLPHVA